MNILLKGGVGGISTVVQPVGTNYTDSAWSLVYEVNYLLACLGCHDFGTYLFAMQY